MVRACLGSMRIWCGTECPHKKRNSGLLILIPSLVLAVAVNNPFDIQKVK